jgi:hypothetical protein
MIELAGRIGGEPRAIALEAEGQLVEAVDVDGEIEALPERKQEDELHQLLRLLARALRHVDDHDALPFERGKLLQRGAELQTTLRSDDQIRSDGAAEHGDDEVAGAARHGQDERLALQEAEAVGVDRPEARLVGLGVRACKGEVRV